MATSDSNRCNGLRTMLAVCAALFLSACDQGSSKKAADAEKPAPSVVVVPVQQKEVSSATEYVGRSQASHQVDIRARVNGVLLERPFAEGEDVDKDSVLFLIDPAEFEANLAAAKAEVARTEALEVEAKANLERYQKLSETDVASVAKLDEAKAKEGQARANVEAAKASLKKAELDVGYTKILSPLSGRIGISSADVGNLIGPDSGVLVTVLKLDPIDITFSIGEREYLNFREARDKGGKAPLIPRIRLANGKLYAQEGKFELADNKVDPATGTLSIRLKFPNPNGLIVPGQFVNVILTSKISENRIVIPQASVQENQTGPFVLVVNKENRVEARPVKTGQRVGADIVALEGLTAGETIIVEGIQKVRPGGVVNPTQQTSSAPQS